MPPSFTKSGAIKFDLSPAVMSKITDNIGTVVEDVLKMARLMAPSVLYIDGAHTPFIKKVNRIFQCGFYGLQIFPLYRFHRNSATMIRKLLRHF